MVWGAIFQRFVVSDSHGYGGTFVLVYHIWWKAKEGFNGAFGAFHITDTLKMPTVASLDRSLLHHMILRLREST